MILYKIRFVPELESEAKDAFREFLGTVYPDWSDRFESFFNEWKMTYTSDGPFETEHDRANINDKMTHPDDFQVWRIVLPQIRAHLIRISTKYKVRSVRKSAQLGVTLKYTPQAEAYFFEISTSVRIVISLCQKSSSPVQQLNLHAVKQGLIWSVVECTDERLWELISCYAQMRLLQIEEGCFTEQKHPGDLNNSPYHSRGESNYCCLFI